MTKLHDYLKTAILLLALLAGIQLPVAVHQYGMLLEARVQESNISVREFQDDADRYFGGDLDQLIAHYDATPDPVMVAGGQSIQAIAARNRLLTRALDSYRRSPVHAYFATLVSPVPEVREQLWRDYQYNVTLDITAIAVGVGFALACAMLYELAVFALSTGLQRLARRHPVRRKRM